VPTHSLEIIVSAAARAAIRAGEVERRVSPQMPVDVLVQHLCTVALGGGFAPDALYAEVRRTAAYRNLPPNVWQWCLDFVNRGGPSLTAYPDYQRVVPDDDGVWRMPDKRLARRHRSNIGTIVSDASMVVQVLRGARLGTMEESFLSRLSPGDCFVFGGRVLEMVRIEQMTAYVRRATKGRPTVPRWSGSRMAISTVLADSLVEQMARAADRRFDSPELKSVRPLLEVQQRWSALPTPETLLVETLRTREGWHLFVYPFAGRHAHIGLASLFAWRAAQIERGTFSIAINDYGFELISATPRDWEGALPALMQLAPMDAAAEVDPARASLLQEILASLNHTEMARRRFREIARVSGLIFQSHPGEHRSSKQLQASAQLFFDVFRRYDERNLLLRQADDEVLSQELDVAQLLASLRKMQSRQLVVKHLERPSPFAFPLMIEMFRERLTNEHLAERIARMVAQLEQAADARRARPGAAVAAAPAPGDDDVPRFARRAPPAPPTSPELQAAADAVRRELDFSINTAHTAPTSPRRRARKPSRPLPPL
jgi:ATP-dependent Lhr-like helicase